MARSIRFHLDEHVANAVAAGLRRIGMDVRTTHDAGLIGASDVEHLVSARADGRVIITEDSDFLVLANQGVPHAGIIYWKQGTKSIGEIIAEIELIWELCEPHELRDHVEFV